jgi:hypothetical protein
MTPRNLFGRPLAAAAVLALAAGFAAAPVSIHVADTGISLKETKAFARRGADDPAGHVRGGGKGRGKDDPVGHVRGGGKGKGKDDPAGDDRGGKGRGKDDGPNHR